MVAYSFKARFAQPIIDGSKTQTIRNPRKRHALIGETLQLYTGMRTKQCKLIREAKCVSVSTIELSFIKDRIQDYSTGTAYTTVDELAGFARADGFESFDDMRDFWAVTHPGVGPFRGVLIRWAP